MAKKAAETVALVIDEEGVEYLIAELLKGVGDTLVCSPVILALPCSLSLSLSTPTHTNMYVFITNFGSVYLWCQASIRRSSSYLIGFFFKYSKLYLVDEAPNMISTLIILLSDSDSSTVEVSIKCIIQSSLLFHKLYLMFFSIGCLGSFIKGYWFCS